MAISIDRLEIAAGNPLIRHFTEGSKDAVLVTRNGSPLFVLVAYEDYEALIQSSREALAELAQRRGFIAKVLRLGDRG